MDMSEDWKSYFPIRSVHFPPLLLSEQSTIKSSLGPLLFSPSPGTQRTEFSSPCIHFKSDDFSTMSNNNLGFLKCPDNDMLVFFPNGDNLHKLGFVKLSLKVDEKPAIDTATDCEFESGGIAKIMVTSVYDGAASAAAAAFASRKGSPPVSAPSVTLGLFLACTTSSTNWFRIDWAGKTHVSVNLGSKQFSTPVFHACWSPNLDEECLLLLDDGALIFFDVSCCSGTQISEDDIK